MSALSILNSDALLLRDSLAVGLLHRPALPPPDLHSGAAVQVRQVGRLTTPQARLSVRRHSCNTTQLRLAGRARQKKMARRSTWSVVITQYLLLHNGTATVALWLGIAVLAHRVGGPHLVNCGVTAGWKG